MAKRRTYTARQRAYGFGGRRRRSTSLARRSPTAISVRVGGPVRRRGGRRRGRVGGGGSLTSALKDYGFNFGAAAIYGYARAGHTENFNELMNKLPGEDFLGVDLRNGAAFYLANRFIFKGRSKVLNHLTIAAVCRSGDKFGATKFTKLEGDGGEGSDSVEADMDD